MNEEERKQFLERLGKRSEERAEPYARCEDCRTPLAEDEVYGEWDDLCENCFADREDEGEPT